jgi:1-acyl-sn-glycerol-3-phosphate acyltransferase
MKFRISLISTVFAAILSVSILAHSSSEVDSFENLQAQRLNQIFEMEKSLDSERERVFNLEHTPDHFREEIYKALSELSEANLKILLDGDESNVKDPKVRAQIAYILNRAAQFSVAHENFQAQLDHMTQVELDYFIEGTFVALQSLDQNLEDGKSLSIKLGMQKRALFYSARDEYNRYMKYHLEIGDPRDGPNRTDAYRSFFTAAKEYIDFASRHLESESSQTFWPRLKSKAGTLFRMLNTAIQITPGMAKVGFAMMKRPNSVDGRSPLVEAIDGVFRKIGKITGHTVKIEGSEHLPPGGKPDGKTVYVVAPTHRDPIRDGIIMANLGMSNYLLAMASDQMMPKKFADKFTENDNIVTVGRGAWTPIQKILKELKRGTTDTIMIYPEGSVSAGFYETRPVREKFSWGLINALLKEGYDVKLIPLTYQNSGQFAHRNTVFGFFKYLENSDSRELRVKVASPIDSRVLRLLAKATKSTAIGNFLRATWLQSLPHNSEFNSGLMRVEAVNREIKKELGISVLSEESQCKRVYKKL